MTAPDSEPLLTADDVTRRLHFKSRSAFNSWRSRMKREGRNDLPAVKLPGGRIRFRPEDVDAFIEQHREH
jgi:hypothetical protein